MKPSYEISTILKVESEGVNRRIEYSKALKEFKSLLREGIFAPDFHVREISPAPRDHVATFYKKIGAQEINATITYNEYREHDAEDLYTLRVYVESPVFYEEAEILSFSASCYLEQLVTRAKTLIGMYKVPETTDKKKGAKDTFLQIRIPGDLKQEFDDEVARLDETQSRILRKLIMYYLDKGSDPRLLK